MNYAEPNERDEPNEPDATLVKWNREKLGRFQQAIFFAVIGKHDEFTFDNLQYVTTYALYLHETLRGKLNEHAD